MKKREGRRRRKKMGIRKLTAIYVAVVAICACAAGGGIWWAFWLNDRTSQTAQLETATTEETEEPQIQEELAETEAESETETETEEPEVYVELTEENKKQFLIPRGFAHGFLVLSDVAEFCYKCDDFYHPNDEGGLAWNDPSIGIVWPEVVGEYRGSADSQGYFMKDGSALNLSEKDKRWGLLIQESRQ